MLKIIKETTQTPEYTFVKGEYNNKPFTAGYYLNDGSMKIRGDFTEIEKQEIKSRWLCVDYQ